MTRETMAKSSSRSIVIFPLAPMATARGYSSCNVPAGGPAMSLQAHPQSVSITVGPLQTPAGKRCAGHTRAVRHDQDRHVSTRTSQGAAHVAGQTDLGEPPGALRGCNAPRPSPTGALPPTPSQDPRGHADSGSCRPVARAPSAGGANANAGALEARPPLRGPSPAANCSPTRPYSCLAALGRSQGSLRDHPCIRSPGAAPRRRAPLPRARQAIPSSSCVSLTASPSTRSPSAAVGPTPTGRQRTRRRADRADVASHGVPGAAGRHPTAVADVSAAALGYTL